MASQIGRNYPILAVPNLGPLSNWEGEGETNVTDLVETICFWTRSL